MYFEDFSIGQKFQTKSVEITKEQIQSFAKDYDPIPLHMDEEYGKNSRYGDIIAPGVMSFMLVWAEIVRLNLWEDSLVAGKSTSIEWYKPVYAGDELRGEMTVTKTVDRNEYNGTLEVQVDVFNQKDELVLRDITESILEKRK